MVITKTLLTRHGQPPATWTSFCHVSYPGASNPMSLPICHHVLSSVIFNCKQFSVSAMDKPTKDDEARKEQQREQYSRESCDPIPSRRQSEDIMPHLLNLYGAGATPNDFEIYAPDATFEDPLMRAHGVKQIKSAFYSLSKVFSESKIVEYNIKENVISNGELEILIDNKQHYKFLGKDIDVISLIKLDVKEGKVIGHEDRWDKKPLLNRETVKLPLVGRLMEVSRRCSMMATHALMSFGKDPTNTKES